MLQFLVTVLPDALPPAQVLVDAPHEGLAKTKAVAAYPLPLRGQFVDYVVEPVLPDGFRNLWS